MRELLHTPMDRADVAENFGGAADPPQEGPHGCHDQQGQKGRRGGGSQEQGDQETQGTSVAAPPAPRPDTRGRNHIRRMDSIHRTVVVSNTPAGTPF